MKFFKQIWLLIWKNLSLRKRQWLRNAVEIIWPLAIFLILASVRKRKPVDKKQTLYFKPRAMPSAGALPFMQSFLCDYDNPHTHDFPEDLPDYSNTSFYKLAEDLSPILQNRTNLELFSRLQDDYNKLMKSLVDLQVFNTTGISYNISLNGILRDPTVVRKFIKDHTTFNETYIDGLMNGKINLTQYSFSLDLNNIKEFKAMNVYLQVVGQLGTLDIMKIITLSVTLKPIMCGTPGVKSLFILPSNINASAVQDQLCKLSTMEWGTLMFDIFRNIDQKALNATLRNTEFFEIYMKRRKVISDEINQLLRDMRSLESFQNVLKDLQTATSNLSSASNISTRSVTDRALDISTLICGRPRGSMSSMNNLNSTISRMTDQNNGKKKPASKNGTCSNIPFEDRTECGWKKIAHGTCLSMGCCFDKSTKGSKRCFCKPGNEYCCMQFHKLASLVGGRGYNIQNLLALILRGKIFYTPDTPQTRKIVQQANLFIKQIERGIRSITMLKQPIATMINLTNTYHNTSNTIRDLINLEVFSSILGINRTNQIRSVYNQTDSLMTTLYKERNQLQTAYNLIDLVGSILDCFNISDYFQPFPNEDAMVKRATDQALDKPLFLSSIVFLNFDAKDGSFPKQAKYKLRLNPAYTPSTKYVRSRFWRPGPSWNGYMGSWTKFYVNFGFVYLQDMLDRAIIEVVTNKSILEPGVYTQQFPYPCYIRDEFTIYISSSLPLFMVLAWVYSCAMIIKSIVLEKEMRLKEVMKVMGLNNAVHWTAWFITSFLFMLISVIILCILFKVGKIITNSNPVVIFWLLTSFGIATISLSCLISVFFSKANVSAACGGIIYFFTYLPFSFTIWFEDQMTYSHKATANLLSTTGFGMACRYLARWEEQGDGAQWSNYYKSPLPGDDYSLGTCVNMMLLDAVLYFIILWYIENVMPGEYGIPRKWYFPFTRSYWLGSHYPKSHHEIYQMDTRDSDSSAMENETHNNNANFEADPQLKVGVNIQNLVKIYKRGKKRAVDGLNLKLYEGQVTSLLGHNGAGKSTTMSVLTGLFPPTKGTAVVYGSDIRTDIDGVRKGLGICPQHNVLFDHLTVEEHMWFYAQLKGMHKKDIKDEIEKYLNDVGLPNKRNELSKNLSGGMKRKLSVALAFIANSKTVILDEPTAGVDPYSRRSIWDLILNYKAGKTILLSTHYMDEADLLGDRISIISYGQLRCCGTPLFLKRKFGEGYHLTFSKDSDPASCFDENTVMKFVSSRVKGSYLKESTGTELCFVLPSEERQNGSFTELFQNLEQNSKSLGINSYGLSDTSLEEVFLKVTEEDESAFDDDDRISLTGPAQRRMNSLYDTESLYSNSSTANLTGACLRFDEPSDRVYSNKKEGLSLWIQQFFALLVKRFHNARRGKKGFLSQILLPAVFVAVAMAVALLRPPTTGLPSLKLSPSQYGQPNYAFVSNVQRDSKVSKRVTEACVLSPGLGTDCTNPTACSQSINKYPFASEEKRWNFSSTFTNLPRCSCATGRQACPKNSYGPEPPMEQLNTKDTLIDLTGRDINEYLIKSTDDFIRRRYGGLSIGDMSKFYPKTKINASYSRNRTSSGSNRNISIGFSATGVQLNAKAWFNNKGYHALPTYLNVLNNAILRANLNPDQDPRDYGIVAYNHPMDFNREQLGDETMMQGFTDLLVSIFVIIALSFVPSSFVVYLVADRNSKSKHLQLVSGLNPVVYWLANYIWDMINYLIPATCCIVIFLAFNQESYVSAANFPVTVCLLLLYGWSMTPLMYPSSFFFNVPSTAYIVLICTNLFVGIVGTISTFILELFQDDVELQAINGYLKQIFLIFPNYCLGRGLMDLARNQFTANVYAVFGESSFQDPFSWSLVGRNLFAMFFCGLGYFTITLLMQYNFFIKSRPGKPAQVLTKDEEEDVNKERMRVHSPEAENTDVLRTTDLTKIYKSRFSRKKLLAVDRLSFGVGKGECFGLLGVNGAGKTTTFKMLTGDTDVTAGNAYVGKFSILKDVNNARKQVGYCPQFDAFDELLTAREMLTYYARIRGIQREFIPQIAEWGISMMDLTLYADKICGDYSGGNKRKLSTSIAFLGNPQLIFLDEPTTGMDPGARRFLWNIISDIVKTGRSVVLTSHSMEECEALCTRLGIMVNGKFLCFGSPQHLRSKYGNGYTIGIRAKLEEMTIVLDFMKANFPDSVLKDQHHYMLEYQVPSSDLLLSQVFQKLEILRSTNAIHDYSVTQTTLDQIFVNFARKQTEGVELDNEVSVVVASRESSTDHTDV